MRLPWLLEKTTPPVFVETGTALVGVVFAITIVEVLPPEPPAAAEPGAEAEVEPPAAVVPDARVLLGVLDAGTELEALLLAGVLDGGAELEALLLLCVLGGVLEGVVEGGVEVEAVVVPFAWRLAILISLVARAGLLVWICSIALRSLEKTPSRK